MNQKSTIAESLAAFATQTRTFSPQVVEQGKRLCLDQLACQIAFSVVPWSKAYRDAIVSLGGSGQASVVYYGDKLAPDQAAFLNSAFGHGGEFDDTQLGSNTHSSAVVVPAVLAIAQQRGLSGSETLAAVITGVEVMVRLGAAAAPRLDDRGFHAPPIVGPFGAAAASSRALGLGAEACAQALSIAGSHSGGTREYGRSGGSVKRIHCAIPAMSGLRSAVMASFGITGPRTMIEGERGILALFAGEFDLSRITKGLGEDYLLLETAYKTITSSMPSHAPLEGVGWLQREHRLVASQIASIDIGASAQAVDNIKTIRLPEDILEAQYSLAFGVAVRLFRGGNGLHDYREEDLKNPDFLDVASRVQFRIDPVCESERLVLNNRSAVVTITMKDGRRFEKRVQFFKGHPKNPLSNDELTEKFMRSTTPIIGEDRAERISDLVWHIESMESTGDLIGLTMAPQ